jgi:hypothetical protein
MKYLWLFCLLLISCADNGKEYEGIPTDFEDISFLTTTNENVNGGTQFAYLSTGLLQDGVAYCFCQLQCSRTSKTVFSLQYNEGTNYLRYKESPSEEYTYYDTSDWCIKYE